MKVIELAKRGTNESAGYQCGECGHVYELVQAHAAKACCRCAYDGCTQTANNKSPYCDEHSKIIRENAIEHRRAIAKIRDEEDYEAARKVSWKEYTGHVFVEPDMQPKGAPIGSCGDGYFRDARELAELYRNNGLPVPTYCWATTPMPKLRFYADELVQNALDTYPESAIHHLDVDALQMLLDTWCDNNDPNSFERDDELAVVLDGIEHAPESSDR